MKYIYVIIFILTLVTPTLTNDINYIEAYEACEKLKNSELIDNLYNLIKNQTYINYTNARYLMYTKIYKDNNETQCVYSNFKLYNLTSIPNPTNMNCEHIWPQSKFSNFDNKYQKVDLHHLRPCKSRINSIRGNNPLGEVITIDKYLDGSYYGFDSNGKITFEPKDESKGNIARSIFYFSIRYKIRIDNEYEDLYREWNDKFQVSEIEYYRNCLIEEFQGNRNPFVDHPEFINFINDF